MKRLLSTRMPRALAVAVAIAAMAALGSVVFGETIDPANDNSQFAFGENAGWIDAEPNGNGGDGVTVASTKLTGWMYGENIGWINMHCDNLSSCGSVNFGVTHNGSGTLGGYAWSENAGWVSFSCSNDGSCASTGNYGVTINIATGEFAGYAWSENKGWISFNCSNIPASCATTGSYGVQTDAATPTATATSTSTSTATATATPTNTPPAGCPGDTDCDGFLDPQQTLHRGPSNTDTTKDNCPAIANPGQGNADGNNVDTSPPYVASADDKTWPMSDAQGDACDTDDDNDGLSDTDELSGAACGGEVTDPLLRDTDQGAPAPSSTGDRVLDGAECALGFDPTSAASKPTLAQCGATSVDTDGDKIQDRIEFCYYNSSPVSTDSDVDKALDGAKDGCEIASINADRIVNSGDQGKLSAGITGGAAAYHPGIDLNKDGSVNSGDQGLMAGFIIPGGQCPG